jgi:hypothetical protein
MAEITEQRLNDSDRLNELKILIDRWLQWDQCELTRHEIEQLRVIISIGFATIKHLVGQFSF